MASREKRLQRWLVGAMLFVPVAVWAAAGIAQLRNGLAVNAAFPVPLNLSINRGLPQAAHLAAVTALGRADRRDGWARIARAEAASRASMSATIVRPELEAGLAAAPASAEGWTSYAEIIVAVDPARAAEAVETALFLAPYDVFWANRRLQLAGQLWTRLDESTRNTALRQTRMLWDKPQYRSWVALLGASPAGREMLGRAYNGAPDTIRAINRHMTAARLRRWLEGRP
jgi:hypothetical protein